MSKKETIGFIGIGVMGKSMASHIMAAGYKLILHTRTKAKAQSLLDGGAVWSETVGALAARCDIVITMLGFPDEVESVYLRADGLVAHARSGSYLVDMSTSMPSLAKRIHLAALERSINVLDAPVSGGDKGAREATLSIMVGGDEAAFTAVRPLFEVMGKNIVHQGKAGCGQHTKMSNQIAIAAGMVAVSEAITYAERAGLNPETVLKSIEHGAAGSWSLSNLVPRMLKGDFNPGFYVKHFIKDMKIAKAEAALMGFTPPGLNLALELYEKLAAHGGEELGTQAIYKLISNKLT